jgi:hypothetical protein
MRKADRRKAIAMRRTSSRIAESTDTCTRASFHHHHRTSCNAAQAAATAARSLDVGLPNSTPVRNWYCDGDGCRCTRRHLLVLMGGHRYQYCAHCGRRKTVVNGTPPTHPDPIWARRVLGKY